MKLVPAVAATGLVLAACGSGGGSENTAQQEPGAAADAGASASEAAPDSGAAASSAEKGATEAAPSSSKTTARGAPKASSAGSDSTAPSTGKSAGSAAKSSGSGSVTRKDTSKKAAKGTAEDITKVKGSESASEKAQNEKIAEQKGGATDTGVTKDEIRLGSINMHGMALGNVLTAPQVRGNLASASASASASATATATAINDRGGILGRRMNIIDCDDGPGEVSRAKACIKKLAGQDKIFSLVTGVDWATASIHDDLKQYKLPYVGAWAYSQTEWQDPYMFPSHMSMIHEAMAGANWAKNVIKPKTYGLVCLTSPEMQLACNEVQKVMDASGAKMVKKADVSISETSMSSQVLAMRAANPDHIIHYVINPSRMAKFMVESAQQNYYPPKGISGNHLAAEVLGLAVRQAPDRSLLDQHHVQAVGSGVHGDHEQVRPW